MYKVLWIDDEHSNNLGLKHKAYRLGLDLTESSFDNYENGIEWLKRNLQDCAAVILDVHCKENKNAAANVTSFSNNLLDVASLCKENNIPWFVLTAGSSRTEEFKYIERFQLNFRLEWASKVYYTKDADEDILFEDIQKAISSNPRRQLEKKYSEIFEFVGDDGREKLLRVMLSIANNNTKNTSCMNDMRQVLEWLINHLKDYGILQKDCKLSNASCCIDEYSKCGLDAIPRYIGVTLQACENATQEGSHDGTNDDVLVTKDLVAGKAPYLIESTLNNLLTVLYWAMHLPKENDGREEFVQYLLSVADFEFCTEGGIVEEKDGVCYVDNCKLLCKNKYQFSKIVGRYVKIISYGDNRHNDRYKYPYFSYTYKVTEDYE